MKVKHNGFEKCAEEQRERFRERLEVKRFMDDWRVSAERDV